METNAEYGNNDSEKLTDEDGWTNPLKTIAEEVESVPELPYLIEKVENMIELTLKVSVSTVLLIDQDKPDIFIYYATGPTGLARHEKHSPHTGIAGWVAANGELMTADDVARDQDFYIDSDRVASLVVKSIVCAPLKVRGRLIGVIEAVNRIDGSKFTKQDEQTFSVVASIAAMAIEFKRAEEKLRRSDKALKSLVEEMSDGYCVIQDAKIAFANNRIVEMLGYEEENVIGRNIKEFLPEEVFNELAEVYNKRTQNSSAPVQYETMLVTKDETPLLVELGAKLVNYGDRPAVSVVVRDIRRRRWMEEIVLGNEELSTTMLENAASGMYLLQDGYIVYVNKKGEEISGYSREELIGHKSIDYVHVDDRELVKVKASEVLKDQNQLPYKFRLITKDSHIVWVLDWVTSIQYKGKQAVLGTIMNLSQYKQQTE